MTAGHARVPFLLRAVRGVLRRFNIYLTRREHRMFARHPHVIHTPDSVIDAERALRRLRPPDESALKYFEKHVLRLARTLTMIPRPKSSGRILELGCYVQLTPFLHEFCGYREVRGASFGQLGECEQKSAVVGEEIFNICIDLFDAERDVFPFADEYFETILACELIEHLACDPMHMLLECRRVLQDRGHLLITTPNVASLTTVARALHGYDNPQVYSKYMQPRAGMRSELPHVREYTPHELRAALVAAGFDIEILLTETIPDCEVNLPVWDFLEEHGYNTALRGEQIYCIAIKRRNAAIVRYPSFLYECSSKPQDE